MARKVKPIMEDGDSLASDSKVEEIVNNESSVMNTIILTEEQKSKLERFDQIEQANIELTKENSMLQEKIAEYLSELNQLRELKDKRPIESNKGDKEKIKRLENECNSLQAVSDNYLQKISELTFDNAKLNSELNELKATFKNKNSMNNSLNSNSNSQTHLEHPAYRPYKNNGYNDWA